LSLLSLQNPGVFIVGCYLVNPSLIADDYLIRQSDFVPGAAALVSHFECTPFTWPIVGKHDFIHKAGIT